MSLVSVPRLSRAVRKALLVAHLLAVGAWIGIDVLVAVLVAVGWFADDPELRVAAYRALAEFVLWPMLVAALASLATGVVLGLGSTWGLVRFRWVAVKLLINVALATLILFALRPSMPDVAALADAVAAGRPPPRSETAGLVYPPAVSLTALFVATVLAVYKPWGRLRAPETTGGERR